MNDLLETSDDQLAAGVREKQASAQGCYEELYRRHATLLLAFLRARTAEADDVHQEVWVRVWERPHLFQGGNFRAWIHTIARNCMADRARRSRPDQLGDSDDVAVRHTPVADVLVREEKAQFRQCLEKLPNRHRQVVERVVGGMDYDELCVALEMNRGTAYKLFCEAKQRLADCVQKAPP